MDKWRHLSKSTLGKGHGTQMDLIDGPTTIALNRCLSQPSQLTCKIIWWLVVVNTEAVVDCYHLLLPGSSPWSAHQAAHYSENNQQWCSSHSKQTALMNNCTGHQQQACCSQDSLAHWQDYAELVNDVRKCDGFGTWQENFWVCEWRVTARLVGGWKCGGEDKARHSYGNNKEARDILTHA